MPLQVFGNNCLIGLILAKNFSGDRQIELPECEGSSCEQCAPTCNVCQLLASYSQYLYTIQTASECAAGGQVPIHGYPILLHSPMIDQSCQSVFQTSLNSSFNSRNPALIGYSFVNRQCVLDICLFKKMLKMTSIEI